MKPVVNSMMEIADEYAKYCKQSDEINLDLGDWLPSLKKICRPLIPGELAFFMADTGVGKSMIIQNIALSCCETSLLFELELPKTLMFERFMAAAHKVVCREVEENFRYDKYMSTSPCNNIFVCDASRLSAKQMYEIITTKAVEKIGSMPLVVFVDYIGLMASAGKSRYERTSIAAEDLKVLAKETNTIVIAATQVHRPSKDGDVEPSNELDLHSAKDSGSIENSCGLLVGAWRDREEPHKYLWLKICKNTKGQAGGMIKCNIDGSKMLITESAYDGDVKDWQDQP